MKKFFTLCATTAMTVFAMAQTNVYSENMGTGASGNPSVSTYTGFQNSTPITYSGTGDIRTTTASNGYTGASGGNSVFFAAAGGRTFIINGINTSNVTTANLSMTFGLMTSQASKNMTIEVSSDNGTTWANIGTVSNTNTSWALQTISSGIPSTNNLSLRFTLVDTSSAGGRLDDVKILDNSGTLATIDVTKTKGSFVQNTYVKSEINFGADAKDVKIYSMYGQVVREVSVKNSQTVNVSDLPKGTYIVTGTVNNNPVSQKILKD